MTLRPVGEDEVVGPVRNAGILHAAKAFVEAVDLRAVQDLDIGPHILRQVLQRHPVPVCVLFHRGDAPAWVSLRPVLAKRLAHPGRGDASTPLPHPHRLLPPPLPVPAPVLALTPT